MLFDEDALSLLFEHTFGIPSHIIISTLWSADYPFIVII